MTTRARTHTRTWPRRVLGTTLALALGLATLAGAVVAGATATGQGTHQPEPTSPTDTSMASLPHAEPGHMADPSAVLPQGRRLVVAFVVGSTGTVASDLLARMTSPKQPHHEQRGAEQLGTVRQTVFLA
jgi:hypothetical protein